VFWEFIGRNSSTYKSLTDKLKNLMENFEKTRADSDNNAKITAQARNRDRFGIDKWLGRNKTTPTDVLYEEATQEKKDRSYMLGLNLHRDLLAYAKKNGTATKIDANKTESAKEGTIYNVSVKLSEDLELKYGVRVNFDKSSLDMPILINDVPVHIEELSDVHKIIIRESLGAGNAEEGRALRRRKQEILDKISKL
jgi:hypothetical protein